MLENGILFYIGLDAIDLFNTVLYCILFYKIIQVNGFKNAYIMTQIFLIISSLIIGFMRYSVEIYLMIIEDDDNQLCWYLGNF